jgi:hypothetical protein
MMIMPVLDRPHFEDPIKIYLSILSTSMLSLSYLLVRYLICALYILSTKDIYVYLSTSTLRSIYLSYLLVPNKDLSIYLIYLSIYIFLYVRH